MTPHVWQLHIDSCFYSTNFTIWTAASSSQSGLLLPLHTLHNLDWCFHFTHVTGTVIGSCLKQWTSVLGYCLTRFERSLYLGVS